MDVTTEKKTEIKTENSETMCRTLNNFCFFLIIFLYYFRCSVGINFDYMSILICYAERRVAKKLIKIDFHSWSKKKLPDSNNIKKFLRWNIESRFDFKSF